MKLPKELYKKTYLISTLLVGIALSIFLLLSITLKKNSSPNLPVDFSFVRAGEEVSPYVNFKLILNPRRYDVSAVRVRLFFEPELLQLTQEISVDSSLLSKVISVTPMSDANMEGDIEIVLGREPGADSPKSSFELANLTFVNIGGEPSGVTIVDEDTQVVDASTNTLPFTTNFAEVN